jgi:hypothetical protein
MLLCQKEGTRNASPQNGFPERLVESLIDSEVAAVRSVGRFSSALGLNCIAMPGKEVQNNK